MVGVIWDVYFFIDWYILDFIEKGGSIVVIVMVCEFGGCLIVVNLGDFCVVLCKNGKVELVLVKYDLMWFVEKVNIEIWGGYVICFLGNMIYKDFKEIFFVVEVRILNILYYFVFVKFMSCYLIFFFVDIYVKWLGIKFCI